MTTYRIYGPARNNGSFGRLARGFMSGVTALGHQASFCPTDLDPDEDPPTDGTKADVAIHVGNPLCAAHMVTRGVHRLRFTMLAPNSHKIPDWVFSAIERAKAEIITPSRWGAGIIERYTRRPMVVRHGLDDAFAESTITWDPRDRPSDYGALHVTNTLAMRKQTVPLVRAWMKADTGAKLYVKTDADTCSGIIASLSEIEVEDMGRKGSVVAITEPWDNIARMYRCFDAVIQPSRAEGFGLVPLEAIACGVPAVIGACSGCLEYASEPLLDHVYPGGISYMEDEGSDEPEIDCDEAVRLAMAGIGRVPAAQRAKIGRDIFNRWSWPAVLAEFASVVERRLSR